MGCIESEIIDEGQYISEPTQIKPQPMLKVFQDKLLLDEDRSKEFLPYVGSIQNSSSASIQYFMHLPSQTKWVGKCNYFGVLTQTSNYQPAPPSSINEYKEALALKLYNLFDVKTPETVLSKQILSKKCQQHFQDQIDVILQNYPHLESEISLKVPRIHLMSKFIDGFQVLGQEFFGLFKQRKHKQYFQGKKHIKGFGRVFAVATFLYDFDFVGKSGSNIGFVKSEEEIIKIDAGEALPFLNDMGSSSNLKHHPKTRDMILGTNGKKITFEDLCQSDKREFIVTSHKILSIKDEKIRQAFQQFILLDPQFQLIFKELINRKINFLKAFSIEVRELLGQQITKITAEKALSIYQNWQNPAKEDNLHKKMVVQAAQLESFRLSEDCTSYQIPKANSFFVERNKELFQIQQVLKKEKTVCICGAAGMGKTELARAYINKAKYKTKIWVHSEYGLAFSQIQTYMNAIYPSSRTIKNPQDLLELFYSVLGNDACLVFDNVENQEELVLQNILNNKRGGHIIVTSRFRHWRVPMIELSPFSLKMTKAYVSQFKKSLLSIEEEQIQQLHNLLEGLPIAINQAIGHLMQNPSVSVTEYCERFRKDGEILLKPASGESSIIFTTLVLSLHSIKQKDLLADEVMSIAAYLSAEHLELGILQKYLKKDLQKTLKMLIGYSIFYAKSNKSYDKFKIHRLTQNFSRLIHRKNNTFSQNLEKAVAWILNQLKYDQMCMDQLIQACKFIPHGLTLCEIERISDKNWVQISNLYCQIASREHQTQNYRDSIQHYEKCIQILKAYAGQNHPDTMTVYLFLGSAYGNIGNYRKKKQILEMLLKVFERNFGLDHPQTSKVLSNLGEVYGSLGESQNCRNSLELSIKIKEKHYGAQHIENAITLMNIGVYYNGMRNYEKGESYLEKSLKIYQKFHGKNHPNVAYVLINLSSNCRNDKNKKQMLLRAKEILQTNFGQDCVHLGHIYFGLGSLQTKKGYYQMSKQYYQKALKIFQQKFNPHHHNIVNTLINLAIVYGDLGNYVEKRNLLRRVLKIRTQIYEGEHLQTSVVLNYLGNTQNSLGNFESSKDYLERALRIQQKHGDQSRFYIALTIMNLAGVCGSLKQYSRSVQLYLRALKIAQQSKQFAYNIGSILLNLGNVYGAMNQFGKQKQVLERSLINLQRTLGPSHPYVAHALNNLSLVEKNRSRKKMLLLRALKINTQCFGQVDSATNMLNLALFYADENQLQQSLRYAQGALKIFERFQSKGDYQAHIFRTLCLINKVKVDMNRQEMIECKKRKDCFKSFRQLPEKCQAYLKRKFAKNAEKKWNSKNNQQKYSFLQTCKFTNIIFAFLSLQFWRFLWDIQVIEPLQSKQEKQYSPKQTWSSMSPAQQFNLIRQFESKDRNLRNCIDFMALS